MSYNTLRFSKVLKFVCYIFMDFSEDDLMLD